MINIDKRLNLTTGISMIFAKAVILGVILGGGPSACLGITKVAKPDLSNFQTFRPRKQPPVPKGFTENPFVDSAPMINPTPIEKKRGFVLFSRPITEPVYRGTHPRPWERTKGLATFATPGEYEPVTFSFYPLRDLHNVRVIVSSLKTQDSLIPVNALDLRAVTYWNIRYPRYTSSGTYRSLPELLEKVNTIDLKKDVCQRFWLKIHVPSNTKPGLYKGYVTIYVTGNAGAWQLPISLRVLDYKLKRDTEKRYGVCYAGHPSFRNLKGAALQKARSNEFKAMRSYGIDMFPTMRIGVRKGKDNKLQLYLPDAYGIEKMLKMGFKGPIPVVGEMVRKFYKLHVPKGKIGSHWHLSENPPNDDIYKDIERAFVDLRKRVAARGWPEMLCCPLDEVAPSSKEFAVKVLAAIHRAGIKTRMTKDPTANDAKLYWKNNSIDVWCSQPFAVPYAQTVADKRHQYWSYPNHNAGERKNRVIMQKGGRMTYGFGFWRSGYKALEPWHWRWITSHGGAEFDYLKHPKISGCGVRIDENQNVIPAVYWECFREGYDDLRYLYTLEDAIVKREGSKNKRCVALLNQGKKLVQEIWNSIPVKKKYYKVKEWTDDNFQARRWEIALLTQKILQFPAVNKKTARSFPSFVNTKKSRAENEDALISKSLKNGWLDKFDLATDNYRFWKVQNKEASKKVIPTTPPTLQFNVKVDYKIDGGGENGKHPIGWPRISRYFKKGTLDLTKYDYLYFKVKVDSNRSEVADDTTPFVVNFASHEKNVKYDSLIDLGDKPRVWLTEQLSIADMIAKSGSPKREWRDLSRIQLVISERLYDDGTQLNFDIKDLSLLKFNRPIIKEIICNDIILKCSGNKTAVQPKGYGFSDGVKRNESLVLTILDSANQKVSKMTMPLTADPRFILETSKLKLGYCTLKLTVLGKNKKILSVASKKIKVIRGFE